MSSAIPAHPKVSVIIPIYGKAGDLPRLIEALQAQTLRPHEIILVDSSPKPIDSPPPGARLVKNPVDVALSWDYNLGAKEASGDHILNLQQDCVPEDKTALERMMKQLHEVPGRVSVVALVTLPEENFRQYNFWGQVLMARWVGRIRQGISGKFDLHRAEVYRGIGGYDTDRFHFAGEDMDLFLRLSACGEVLVSDVAVIHYHAQNRPVRCRDVVKKHFQLAESFGALFRKWGLALRRIPYAGHWTHHLAKFLYPVVLLVPLFPLPALLALLVGANLANLETLRIRHWKTFALLPWVNVLLVLAGLAGTLRGLLTGRQRYSVNK
ncbi:MAG: glycosyl transferase family protein [Limisphaerales bacterium]|nr:MAG: glycosyl transferase family protein [Limisphaerales bacterium]KAG0508785.1 MAG: glycosyl transferase family protein [Limisphaerales bacterium]TXT50524.1 MAG: glycosyl transferase family protein [Limisphaerales bacterium]